MMETEKFLNNLRREYEETEPSFNLKLYGWGQILPKLGGRQKPAVRFFYRLAMVGALVLIFAMISLGVYKTAQAALPGSALYPIKRLSENLINKANGNNQASIDNRADEIVNLAKQSKTNSQELKTVVDEYKKSVEAAPQKDSEFQKKLEEQHKEFNKVLEQAPGSEHEIKDAINVSEIHDSSEDHHSEGD